MYTFTSSFVHIYVCVWIYLRTHENVMRLHRQCACLRVPGRSIYIEYTYIDIYVDICIYIHSGITRWSDLYRICVYEYVCPYTYDSHVYVVCVYVNTSMYIYVLWCFCRCYGAFVGRRVVWDYQMTTYNIYTHEYTCRYMYISMYSLIQIYVSIWICPRIYIC